MVTAIAFILSVVTAGSSPTNTATKAMETSTSTNKAVRVRAVRPRTPIQEVEPVSATVAEATSVEPVKPTTVVVPDVIVVELAKATEADAPEIAAAVYAKLVALIVPNTPPAELVKIQREWYEKLSAVPSSKAWWLLQMAKDKASRGESVDKLKKLFDAAIEAGSKEDD